MLSLVFGDVFIRREVRRIVIIKKWVEEVEIWGILIIKKWVEEVEVC